MTKTRKPIQIMLLPPGWGEMKRGTKTANYQLNHARSLTIDGAWAHYELMGGLGRDERYAYDKLVAVCETRGVSIEDLTSRFERGLV